MDNYSGNAVPAIIDEQMILESLEDNISPNNLSDITSLSLNYKNILKINNIWFLKNLVKLQLNNNIIEKIQGLEELSCLIWLDLSFNNIEKIECLDSLKRLEDLSLYNNKIERIENLDSLSRLKVISIGNNKISDLENITYLRRFKGLKSLTLSGNPLTLNEKYKSYAVALIPQLIYLDCCTIDEKMREESKREFEIEIAKLHQTDVERDDQEESFRKKLLATEKKAFVEKLKKNILLEMMFSNDKEGKLLSEIPLNKKALEEYSIKLNVHCEELYKYGTQSYKERQNEITEFQSYLTKLRHKNEEMATTELNKFSATRNDVIHNMLMSSRVKDDTDLQNIEDLKSTLLLLEVQLVDQTEEAIREFEQNLKELTNNFVHRIRCNMTECRNLETSYYNKVLGESFTVLEKVLANEIDDDFLTGNLANVLMDKDSIQNWAKSSYDTHIQVLDNVEDEIIGKLDTWMKNCIKKLQNDEVLRNRARVFEVIHLIDSLKEEEFDGFE